MCWRDVIKHIQAVNAERAKRALREKREQDVSQEAAAAPSTDC